MTATELRDALDRLHWSQREAAHQLEIAPRLLRYWAAGDERYPIPAVAAYALKWLMHIAKN